VDGWALAGDAPAARGRLGGAHSLQNTSLRVHIRSIRRSYSEVPTISARRSATWTRTLSKEMSKDVRGKSGGSNLDQSEGCTYCTVQVVHNKEPFSRGGGGNRLGTGSLVSYKLTRRVCRVNVHTRVSSRELRRTKRNAAGRSQGCRSG
jgi:hypothetical protein